MISSSLEKPLRLAHHTPAFAEALASLGALCRQATTHGLELRANQDTSNTLITTDEALWFPSLGLSLRPDEIEAVHASPAASPLDHAGVLEIDFRKSHDRLGFAVASDSQSRTRFHHLLGRFGLEEVESPQLEEWRQRKAPLRQMCPCCEAASDQRRAHPEGHPIAQILHHLTKLELELELTVNVPGFSLQQLISP
ncbi:MAG: hypothetical protein ACQKBU_05625, partial [Verrucomicrobiales bacterium]